MEKPLSLAIPLASSVPNEGSASINVLDPTKATLADDGRDPIEEASVDAAEPFAMEEPLSLAIPLASFVPNEGSASINVLVMSLFLQKLHLPTMVETRSRRHR